MSYIIYDKWKNRIICESATKPTEKDIMRIIDANNEMWADNEDNQITGGDEDVSVSESPTALDAANYIAQEIENKVREDGPMTSEDADEMIEELMEPDFSKFGTPLELMEDFVYTILILDGFEADSYIRELK